MREIFGIADTECVIGFVAESINEPRKGMQLLRDALKTLAITQNHIHLLIAGSGVIESTGFRFTHVGSIQNGVLLSHFYSACDVFVCPSTQDNLPNTVLEALACNIPVIGFQVGGLPDLLVSKLHGTLASLDGGAESLAAAISARIQSASTELNERIPFFQTLGSQARKYLQLYGKQSLLSPLCPK
jgi:glycosyltransferase involved in cell wall biosynthesis